MLMLLKRMVRRTYSGRSRTAYGVKKAALRNQFTV